MPKPLAILFGALVLLLAPAASGLAAQPAAKAARIIDSEVSPAASALAAQPAAKAADILDFEFSPTSLTIGVGQQIAWTNTGERPHTVTDRGGTFDTNPIAPGETGTATFTVPGTYQFFCRINPSKMNGVIVVEPSGVSPVQRIEALDPARASETLRFGPAELEMTTGSIVLFANVGGKPHTLTADDGSFDSGIVTPGAEEGRFAGTNTTIAVTEPGVFPFHCEIHPEAMKGKLIVTGEPRAGPAAASDAPRNVTIDMVDFSFSEPEVSVAPGGELTWRNQGQAAHTATFDDVDVDTGNVAPGKSDVVTAPTEPGSYSYRCIIHPAQMRAVVVVVDDRTADPTKRPVAQSPPQAVGGGGPGGRVSGFVLATTAIGMFLGGFGTMAFLRRRPNAVT